jgi:hypothetical protein
MYYGPYAGHPKSMNEFQLPVKNRNEKQNEQDETIDVQYTHIEGDTFLKTEKTICELSKMKQKLISEEKSTEKRGFLSKYGIP